MTAKWYPGHMRKAMVDLMEWASKVDVVFEVLDARAPYTTCNARMMSKIRTVSPVVKLLNKNDLASQGVTGRWVEHFAARGIEAIPVQSTARSLERRVRPMLEEWRDAHRLKRVRMLVVGIPNVGKSTWINALALKKKARVGPAPGVTRGRQWVSLGPGIEFLDTPGVLDAERKGPGGDWKLAVLACIKTEVEAEEAAALALIEYGFGHAFRGFGSGLGMDPGSEPLRELRRLALEKNLLLPGGEPDMGRAAAFVLKRFREGRLGRISLETPEDLASAAEEAGPDEDSGPGFKFI